MSSKPKNKKPEWIVSEKCEIEITDGKILKTKKILSPGVSPKSKITFDQIIKTIGIIAIFFPLILLYYQKENQIKMDNRRALIESYTNLSQDLFFVEKKDVDSPYYIKALQKIEVEYPIKLIVYSQDSFALKLNTLFLLKEISYSLKMVNKIFYELQKSINLLKIDSNKILSSLNSHYLKIENGYRKLENHDSTLRTSLGKEVKLALDNITTITLIALAHISPNSKNSTDIKVSKNKSNGVLITEQQKKLYQAQIIKASSTVIECYSPIDNMFSDKKKNFEKSFLSYVKSF